MLFFRLSSAFSAWQLSRAGRRSAAAARFERLQAVAAGLLVLLAACPGSKVTTTQGAPDAPNGAAAIGSSAAGGTSPGGTATAGGASGTPAAGTVGTAGSAAAQPATPFAKNMTFRGRFDVTDPSQPLFEYSSCSVSMTFSGSKKVTVNLNNIENRISTNTVQVYVDGNETGKITFTPGVTVYPIADNLAAGTHTVQIAKAQEYGFGAIAFGGFNLDAGATMLPPAPLPTRRLQFVGSSTLSGWGADGNDKTTPDQCSDESNFPLTNAEHSIPRYTSDILKADFHNLSRGAAGILVTFAQNVKLLPQTYNLITDHNSPLPWDHNQWRPDAVIFETGGSDFTDGDTINPLVPVGQLRGYSSDTATTKQTFSTADFQAAFIAFIKTIRANSPGVLVVLVNTKNETGQSKDTFFASLDAIAASFPDGKVVRFDYFQTPIANMPTPYADWYGMVNELGAACEDHPAPTGSQYMSARLAAFLKMKLGW